MANINKPTLKYYKILFTINHPVNIRLSLDNTVKYAKWQLEKGNIKGTEHIQGCLLFYRQHRLAHVKKVLGNGDNVHIENVFARDFDSAIKYCSKEDTRIDGPWEFIPKNSLFFSKKEKEVKELQDLLQKGVLDKELVNNYPLLWIKYKTYINDWRRKNCVHYSGEKLNFEVYFGDSGTGKTTRAKAFTEKYYIKPGGKWFCDNYEGQETIILDEVDKLKIPFHELLKLVDGSITSFETKGGFSPQIISKNIIATSNNSIEDWFNNLNRDELCALIRRVDKYLEFRFKPIKSKNQKDDIKYVIEITDRSLDLIDFVKNYYINNKK